MKCLHTRIPELSLGFQIWRRGAGWGGRRKSARLSVSFSGISFEPPKIRGDAKCPSVPHPLTIPLKTNTQCIKCIAMGKNTPYVSILVSMHLPFQKIFTKHSNHNSINIEKLHLEKAGA